MLIAGYCIFEKRISYIQFLWEYKQPSDSDATWIGHNLIPDDFNELIQSFYSTINEKTLVFSGHHGSSKYVKEYLILLICKMLQAEKPNLSNQFSLDIKFNTYDIYKLSDLIHTINSLIEFANNFKTNKLLNRFKFNNTESLFNDKVIPFLKNIVATSEKQVALRHRELPINTNKVENFINEVISKFYEIAIIRQVFKKYLCNFKELPNINCNAPRKSRST